ncbi:MAG: DNA cytosine methyltransferase [Gammaproteobacteria bacterium]|nr:DNA cytosine methyltransferase [Gammaproteobacteria bacterium]
MNRPVGIDLFAGAGGLTLSFEQAGFDIAAAVELDPIHACVHAFNFPNCHMLPRSVIGLHGSEIRSAAGIGSKSVDVVFGGAPCQGFSLIGQRLLDDPRNQLVKEFVRVVTELDAKYFVFENVKGLTLGKQRLLLEELVDEFSDNGYVISSPWQVLNAASFGVPQNRERLFLMGARRGLPVPKYPRPQTSSAMDNDLALAQSPSCEDALQDLPEAEDFAQLWAGDSVTTDAWGEPGSYAKQMRCASEDAWGFGYRRGWDPRLLTSSARTNHTATSRSRFLEAQPGTTEPGSRLFKLSRHGVANTLRAGTDSARGAFTSPRPIHYERPRCVTVREMARLHGFPDWFRFHVTKWHGARQIGNSVPPPLARAVAEEVILALSAEPSVPDRCIELGDTSLLQMDMTSAAEYWRVPIPIAQRKRGLGRRRGLENSRRPETISRRRPAVASDKSTSVVAR